MIGRTMYIWKLAPIISAEGGVLKVVEKAKRAKLAAIWIKIADGRTPYFNVRGATEKNLRTLYCVVTIRILRFGDGKFPTV